MDSPESIEFWGSLTPPNDSIPLARLVISIYDHLKSIPEVPIKQMSTKKAKPRLSVEMVLKLFEYLEIKDLDFTAEESRRLKTVELKDKFYFEFFSAWGIGPDHIKREGTDSQISYLTRAGFKTWLALHIMAYPDEMHRKINALLAKEDHLFLDPFTEEPWEYPQIPRCAFPEKPGEKYADWIPASEKKWAEAREKILAPLRPKLPPRYVPTSSLASSLSSTAHPRSNGMTAMELLGLSNNTARQPSALQTLGLAGRTSSNQNDDAARLALAVAELNAQRMRSAATRNAYQERRYDPNTRRNYSYTPGNF